MSCPLSSLGARLYPRNGKGFLCLVGELVEMVPMIHTARECRDRTTSSSRWLPTAGTDLFVSGDDDLLVLLAFRTTPVLTPSAWLER